MAERQLRKPGKRLRQILATNVKALRLAKGLSQEKFAYLCGLHRTYVGSVEREGRNVTLSTLELLASSLPHLAFQCPNYLPRQGDQMNDQIDDGEPPLKNEEPVLQKGTILNRWSISAEELTQLVDENLSLRGIMMGYVAELKLAQLLDADSHISQSFKHDDHDRKKKGDRVVVFRSNRFIIESKSLQTASVKKIENRFVGKAQVDGSDRRRVTMPDGTTVNTTLLRPGEFDVLAVNCFAFENEWRWVFCKNADLPKSTWRGYTPIQQKNLIASLVKVSWPPEPPFKDNIFEVLEELVRERSSSGGSASASA